MTKKQDILLRAKEKVNAKKAARQARLKEMFPFNILNEMWHGITGEPMK